MKLVGQIIAAQVVFNFIVAPIIQLVVYMAMVLVMSRGGHAQATPDATVRNYQHVQNLTPNCVSCEEVCYDQDIQVGQK